MGIRPGPLSESDCSSFLFEFMGGTGGGFGSRPPLENQEAIGFLRNCGTDPSPLKKQLEPIII